MNKNICVSNIVFTVLLVVTTLVPNAIYAQPIDDSTSVWLRIDTTGPVRYWPGGTYDRARNRVVIFGGQDTLYNDFDPVHFRDETFEWDGVHWAQVATTGPTPRHYPMMVYDEARQNTILFGGWIPDWNYDDTWIWNGDTWIQLNVPIHPSQRSGVAAAYDRYRERIVAFGGNHWQSFYNETWEWDGTTWSFRSPGPSPRAFAAMTYDSRRHVCVMFGGMTQWQQNGGRLLRETWEWNGANWTLVDTTGPDARAYCKMTYDSIRGKVVLFGGCSYPWWQTALIRYNDTWEWDGTSWVQVGSSGPNSFTSEFMFFHDTLRKTVLFENGDTMVSPTGNLWVFPRFVHNVGVTSIIAPTGVIPIDTTITTKAEVRNYGNEYENFPVIFRIGSLYEDTAIVTLAAGERDTVVFRDWHATQRGTFVVACSTMLDGDSYPRNNIKKGIVIVRDTIGSAIYSITPSHGGDIGFVTVDIYGANFDSGAIAKLIRMGQGIIFDSMADCIDSTHIVALFDLRQKQRGNWNIVVVNPSGDSCVFYDGFIVETGIERTWLDIVGRNQVPFGRPTPFQLTIGNMGNVDIIQSVITVSTSGNVILRSYEHSAWLSDTLVNGEDSLIAYTISILRVGQSINSMFHITPELSGQFPIEVKIWLNPYYDPLCTRGALESNNQMVGNIVQYHDLQAIDGNHNLLWPPTPPEEGTIIFQDDVGPGNDAGTGHEGVVWKDYLTNEINVWENLPPNGTRLTPWEDFCKRTYRNWPSLDGSGWQGSYRPMLSGAEIQTLHNWLYAHSDRPGQTPLPFNWSLKCTDATHMAFLEATGRQLIAFHLHSVFDPPSLDWTLLTGLPWLGRNRGILWQVPKLFIEGFTGELPLTVSLMICKMYMGVRAWDPNDKANPAGFDSASYIPQYEQFHYVVYFENVDTATAPAEDIVIIDTLDSNFDWTTFAFDASSHTPTAAIFDPNTGVITWQFEDINLPPNDTPPQGEGWVSFTINPKEDLASGTEIKNRSWIVFDVNPPMSTREVLNTIDAGSPSSNILALPETTSTAEFTVHWSGKDDSLGSGIRSYDIYVKIDTGDFVPWQTGITETTATYVCRNEGTHYFYSIATDNVGWRENPPENPDAFTIVTGFPRWSKKADITAGLKNVKQGGAIVSVGDSMIFAFKGNNKTEFYAYNITNDTWLQKCTIPSELKKKKVKTGGTLCYDGSGTIYATKGGNTKEFWAYNVASDNWTLKASVPVPKGLKGGTSIVYYDGKVYLLAGGQKATDPTNFYTYNPTADTIGGIPWDTLTKTPFGSYNKPYKDGSCLAVMDGKIYALKGGDKQNYFSEYTMGKAGWISKESIPVSDSLYGKTKKVKVKDGGAMVSDGINTIYAIKGGGANVFWKYTPTGGWARLESITRLHKKSVPKSGAALAYAGDYVWLLKGNNTLEFWRYTPSEEVQSKTIPGVMAEQIKSFYPFLLYQNKPNPFKSQTIIRYSIPTQGKVSLSIYDVSGRLVKSLVNEHEGSGIYSTNWNGTDNQGKKVSQGVYFYALKSDGQKMQKKMLMLR